MIGPTGHLGNNLARQRPGDSGDILPSIVPVPEAAVVSSSPGIDLAFRGQNNRVSRTTGNLSDANSPQGVHVGWLVLIGGVPEAQLAVLASAPGKDGQATFESVVALASALLRIWVVAVMVVVASAVVVIVIAVIAVASRAEAAAFAQRTSCRGSRFGGSSSGRHIVCCKSSWKDTMQINAVIS